MSHYRYITDCLTGLRQWRWYGVVGRPERPLWFPCAKAALILPPLLGVPSNIAPFQGGWPWEYPSEYAAGFRGVPSLAGRNNAPQPGEGLLAVPGPFSEYAPYLNSITPVIQSGPVDFVDISQSTHVPEPSSLVVLAVGAGAAVLVKRWRA